MRQEKKFDVLAVGELNLDIVLTGLSRMPALDQEVIADDFNIVLGSSTAICASGLSRLGLRTAFASLVGDDDYGASALRFLNENGVDTRFVTKSNRVKTGVTLSLGYRNDRALVTYPGAIAAFSAHDFDWAAVAEARHIHVGSFFLQQTLQKDLAALFAYAHTQGVTTSLDAGCDDSGQWDYGIAAVLAHTDIFLPNENEACRITGESNPVEAAKRLGARYTVVKCGAEGAVCWHANKGYTCPSFPVNPVDTTGAGDSFNAGFIYGFLQGCAVMQCLRLGNACGAVSVTRIGGATGCASPADLRSMGV